MTGLIKYGVLGTLVSCLAAGAAWAQESKEDLSKELLALAERAETGNGPVLSTPILPTEMTLAPEPMFDDSPTGTNTWLKSIKLSGFLDVGYTKALNGPNGPGASLTNPGRMFDVSSNGFLVNMAEVMLEKVASADSPVGFRLKLGFGKDAGFLASTEGIGTSAQFDLVEGYAEYLAPIGAGLDFKVGKLATLAGYEVIESKDNWGYSRSLLFTWAIPLTHTGIRATYTFADQFNATLGFVNGWNMIADNNNSKTLEGQLNFTPWTWLSLILNDYYGPEGTVGTSNGDRNVFDFCGTVTYETWKFGINFDVGNDNALGDTWYGTAIYVKDQIVRWFATSIRGETFRDQNGAVTAFVPAAAGAPANTGFTVGSINLYEITLTNEIRINDNLLFRIEYRHDHANKGVFPKGTAAQKELDTFGFEAIFMF